MYFIVLKKECSRTTDEYVCSGVYVLSERLIFFFVLELLFVY